MLRLVCARHRGPRRGRGSWRRLLVGRAWWWLGSTVAQLTGTLVRKLYELLTKVKYSFVQSSWMDGWMDRLLVHRHFLNASGSPVNCFAGVVEACPGLSVSFTLRAHLRPIFTSDDFQHDPAPGTPSLQNMPSSNAPPPPTQERPDSRTPNP